MATSRSDLRTPLLARANEEAPTHFQDNIQDWPLQEMQFNLDRLQTCLKPEKETLLYYYTNFSAATLIWDEKCLKASQHAVKGLGIQFSTQPPMRDSADPIKERWNNHWCQFRGERLEEYPRDEAHPKRDRQVDAVIICKVTKTLLDDTCFLRAEKMEGRGSGQGKSLGKEHLLAAWKLCPQKESILIVGNPGVGKSAFLNALIQKDVFQSGYHTNGEQNTSLLQEEFDDASKRYYVDTPGLYTVTKKNRENAAKQLHDALQEHANVRLFFLVTLEADRVRAADFLLMEKVLEAVSPIKDFGVIINKLGEKMDPERCMKNFKTLWEAHALDCELKARNLHVSYFPDWKDSSCPLHTIKEFQREFKRVRDFIEDLSPSKMIPKEVKDIKIDNMQEDIERLEAANRSLEMNLQEKDGKIKYGKVWNRRLWTVALVLLVATVFFDFKAVSNEGELKQMTHNLRKTKQMIHKIEQEDQRKHGMFWFSKKDQARKARLEKQEVRQKRAVRFEEKCSGAGYFMNLVSCL